MTPRWQFKPGLLTRGIMAHDRGVSGLTAIDPSDVSNTSHPEREES